MNDLVLHTYGELKSNDAVAIIGFPSLGLVSSIATSFLAKELKLDLIAAVSSPSFPPYAIVQGGVPMPPVRIYGGCRKKDESCTDGIECEDLFVITSEFVPKPDQTDEMASLIVDWCLRNNVHTVITLDGIPLFAPDMYSIIGVGSTENARQMMKDYEIESIEDGMVRGLSSKRDRPGRHHIARFRETGYARPQGCGQAHGTADTPAPRAEDRYRTPVQGG